MLFDLQMYTLLLKLHYTEMCNLFANRLCYSFMRTALIFLIILHNTQATPSFNPPALNLALLLIKPDV